MAKGGGCGCKLSPTLLRDLLQSAKIYDTPPAALLVGAKTADDAAVWQLDEETAIVSTADFFSPLVDDARDFGRIAAANAISDVYAMGGEPLFALALAAMPKDILSTETIADIFSGGREICQQAGAVIAGGHSIDAQEPLYGLAVVGRVHPSKLLTNSGAQVGDALLLGKPLGTGILSAAYKKQCLLEDEYEAMLSVMLSLNKAGAKLANLRGVHALTDVTGFGLLGHLQEICKASGCAAEINFSQLPLLTAAVRYAQQGIITGASGRNWQSVQHAVTHQGEEWQRHILTDPQTSGGLLCCCAPEEVSAAIQVFADCGQMAQQIGVIQRGQCITVRE